MSTCPAAGEVSLHLRALLLANPLLTANTQLAVLCTLHDAVHLASTAVSTSVSRQLCLSTSVAGVACSPEGDLEVLSFYGFPLNGSLSAWPQLGALHTLWIPEGALQGELPSEWPETLPNLQFLMISGATFTSTLPASAPLHSASSPAAPDSGPDLLARPVRAGT